MSRTSLSRKLLQVLRLGAESLNDEARRRVCLYVESQRTADEAFINRGGRPDLYYTMFGWMLCHALDMASAGKKRKAYLDSIDATRLDDLHHTIYVLCQALHRLLSLPHPFALLPFSFTAHTEKALRQFFETYQRHGSGGGTNAWAARLAVSANPDSKLTEKLLAMQHPSGGFMAHENTAMPDLLSTAVALFALSLHNIRARYDALPFLEAHWQPDGSFAATLLDEHGDTEYQFYGLLAIGSLQLKGSLCDNTPQ